MNSICNPDRYLRKWKVHINGFVSYFLILFLVKSKPLICTFHFLLIIKMFILGRIMKTYIKKKSGYCYEVSDNKTKRISLEEYKAKKTKGGNGDRIHPSNMVSSNKIRVKDCEGRCNKTTCPYKQNKKACIVKCVDDLRHNRPFLCY